MTNQSILIVEDEPIVAKDVQLSLEQLGYKVSGHVATGEMAIQHVEQNFPDLVLMDIVLKGNMDGIQAGKEIWQRLTVPVVYLSAYADDATFQRAKKTFPFGYVVKPFRPKELFRAVELGLSRYEAEKSLTDPQAWLSALFNSLRVAIITTDNNGKITFINHQAETLTGWNESDALGQDLFNVFNVKQEGFFYGLKHQDSWSLNHHTLAYFNSVTLCSRNYGESLIQGNVSPIVGELGKINGIMTVFSEGSTFNREPQSQDGFNHIRRETFYDNSKVSCFLTMCSACHKIRGENGAWTFLETYFEEHTRTKFTHGICPDCKKNLYPSISDTNQ